MTTPFHSKYWAHELTLRSVTRSIESLSRQRDELIGRIEKQLRQSHVLNPVFAFRWRLA